MKFRGSSWFRQRIVCATLSGRTIAIKDIRAKDEKPGLLGMLVVIQFQTFHSFQPPLNLVTCLF